jgi:23S rRNA (adenine2503-C2)-methyltransferase
LTSSPAVASQALLDLTLSELEALLRDHGLPPFRALQVWHGIYRDLASSYDEITTLPRALRQELSGGLDYPPLAEVRAEESADRLARKGLLRLADGETVESVLLFYERRQSVCVSTQVGCTLSCLFCATGQAGFVRDLSAGEIVGQVLAAARVLRSRGERLTHVVYMGMGEPFLNYEATLRSIRILNDKDGFDLRARAFTVSTVGIVPGIERFAREGIQANLAVSLHAGTDALRDQLVPANRRYPLADLLRACRAYAEKTHRRVTFEVALIDGVNDSAEDARAIARLLQRLLCHVNLIPMNPVPGTALRPSPRARVRAFAQALEEARIPVTVRLGRGIEIQAGCGQLRGSASARGGRGRSRVPASPSAR